MGAFGSGREDYQKMSPAERSGADLQDRKPVFNGPARDTFEEGGRCFFMGREVNKDEHESLLGKYNALLDHSLELKQEELREAA
jgi:hypothetical protein